MVGITNGITFENQITKNNTKMSTTTTTDYRVKFSMKVEKELFRDEQAMVRALQMEINDANAVGGLASIQALYPTIKTYMQMSSMDWVIGCGGSHIWIHRTEEHVEGDPIKSERLIIIAEILKR